MSKKIRVFAHGSTKTHYYPPDDQRSICQKQILREYEAANLPAWDSHEYDRDDVCSLCADRVAELTLGEEYE